MRFGRIIVFFCGYRMKKFLLVFVVLIIILIVFSSLLFLFLFSPSNNATALGAKSTVERIKDNEYLFSYIPGANSDDIETEVILSGSSCNNLMGKIYYSPKKTLITNKRFYCLPFIEDIHSLFSTEKNFYADSMGLGFENGVRILSYMDADVSGEKLKKLKAADYQELERRMRGGIELAPKDLLWIANTRSFYKILSIGTPVDNVTDVVVYDFSVVGNDLDKKRKTFKMLCWAECKRMQSLDAIRDKSLFQIEGLGIAYSGAFIFFDYSAPRYIPNYQKFIRNCMSSEPIGQMG